MTEHTPTSDPTPDPTSDPSSDLGEGARRTFAAGLHPVNVGHLVMGVAFLGMVLIWALVESGTAATSDLRWLLPVPWVAAGAVGLVATAPRLRGARD
jgi:hypothetical protein